MSLAITLVGVDGIVMASDSRETAQAGGISYHRDDVHKLSNLTEYIGIMSVGGSVGFANWLLHYFVTKVLPVLETDSADITDLSRAFSQFLAAQYQIYSEGMNTNWLVLGENLIDFTLAGYTQAGQSQIIRLANMGRSIPFVPELLDEPYYFSGKDTVAYHLVRKLSLEQPTDTMNVELLKRIATLMIVETAQVDDHVSPPIDLTIIKQGTPVECVKKDEKKQLLGFVNKVVNSGDTLRVLERGEL